MKKEVYYIGGSTCCGKSTIAERLCEKRGFRYYKLDDDLARFMREMAESGHSLCKKVNAMTMEQMWMRSPALLCREVLAIYRHMFAYVVKAIAELPGDGPVLAEGAGFLPELMLGMGVDAAHYICLVPTREFQMEQYARRPWIHHYLEGCSQPLQAFSNWMKRDFLFAQEVLAQAKGFGYATIVVNGKRSVASNLKKVEKVFRLSKNLSRI